MKEDAAYQKALNAVNKARAFLKLEPLEALLPGKKNHALSCSLSRSVRYGYKGSAFKISTSGRIQIHRRGQAWWKPAAKTISGGTPFVRRFDAGKYPELVVPR